MRLNTARDSTHTYEGAKAKHINAEQQLRRSVMACLLWEKEFYEDGVTIADRICDLIPSVSADYAANAANARATVKQLENTVLRLEKQLEISVKEREKIFKELSECQKYI